MKKFVLHEKGMKQFLFILSFFALALTSYAQSGPGGGSSLLTNGLVFENYSRISGSNLQVGSVYLFQDVATDIDATVRIDSLVNGASLNILDDNSNGLGYTQAFQPEVNSGNVIGYSYAVFTFTFYKANTSEQIFLESVNATALDIDGNANLKEFAEMRMGGGIATYMSTTTDISLLSLLTGKFKGENILGIERAGIDTASYANMFTATNSAINSFAIRYGTFTVLPSTSSRQFSLYMKGFQYPFQATLPLELLSFTATLNKNQVDLKWTTMNEMNVSHFIVEKSYDGKNFTDAGLVFAYGNTNEKKNYSLADNVSNVQSGILYYRLRSYDADSKTQLSGTRVIRIGKQKETITLLTYPNPVSSELRVTIPSNWQNKEVRFEIFNGSGQLVQLRRTTGAGQTETFNVSGFAKGFYVVKAASGTETAQQSIIKN